MWFAPRHPGVVQGATNGIGGVLFVWTVCHYSTSNVPGWLTTGNVVQVFTLSKVTPAHVFALSDAMGPA
jgi:hypothetical protein